MAARPDAASRAEDVSGGRAPQRGGHHGDGREGLTPHRRPFEALATFLLLLALLASSPAAAEENSEFWPEAQFHYWFDEHRSRAILAASVSRERDSGTSFQAEQGLTFEHRFADYLAARIGYRHGSATDGGAFYENRLITEQTFRSILGSTGVTAEARSRQDFRWLNSGFFVRLRERLLFQRDFTIDNYTFTPYAGAEVFYDTRYGQFSRYRLTLGVTLPIRKHISVEPYLVRQVDWIPGVITNALGFTVIIAY